MRRYLTIPLALLLTAGPVHADAIARQGDNWLRITARPCKDEKVLQHIPDAGRRLDFRAATAHWQGQDYSACWTPVTGGVVIVYEDGDQGAVPAGDLKPVPEA